MRMRLPISILAISLAFAARAGAQLSLTPPALQTPATKPAATPKPKPHAIAKKPARPKPSRRRPKPSRRAEAKPATPEPSRRAAKPPAPTATVTPAPAPQDPNVDLVYGAYQRGQYKTAFDLATARAQAGDVKAMTMLGELYANAHGRQARLCEGRRLVQARRRRRRPRGDVRARDDAARRPRRPGRPAGGRETAGLRRQARRTQGRL